MKKLLIICCFILLTACQHNIINKEHPSAAQDARIQYIILHYTAADLSRSLDLLTKGNVSSHYLISQKGTVYQLVEDDKRAWHAGLSSWQGRTFLNNSSIGIEMVNLGYKETPQKTLTWFAYTDDQIKALTKLLKDLQAKYNIPADHILGHSDIAPLRKSDPGPLFPWRTLAKEGLATWPNEQAVAKQQQIFLINNLPSANWVQQKLNQIGYEAPYTGIFDKDTQKVIRAFQMRYQPENISGFIDAKTAALLTVVANKDFKKPL